MEYSFRGEPPGSIGLVVFGLVQNSSLLFVARRPFLYFFLFSSFFLSLGAVAVTSFVSLLNEDRLGSWKTPAEKGQLLRSWVLTSNARYARFLLSFSHSSVHLFFSTCLLTNLRSLFLRPCLEASLAGFLFPSVRPRNIIQCKMGNGSTRLFNSFYVIEMSAACVGLSFLSHSSF